MRQTGGEAIAIVGMACRYPDARTPLELWENVLAQRRAFRGIPTERLRLDDYGSTDPAHTDKTYASEAAVIEGYDFDRVRFRVSGSAFRSADLTHWLALDVASQALADAGFGEGVGLPKATTGVLVGNTLTGEFSRASTLRLRWPYVRRTVAAALSEQGWSAPQRHTFLETLETQFKAPFSPVGEETLAGGLSNTIAGRICNHFDLNGGGYTVDGACASSLLAVTTACSALVAGDLDMALAGGVDLSLDPFELVGFARAGALTHDEMRIYDARSAGFWPGEGCGFVLLMRYADALAQGCRIDALIQGWGISSDGSGGITRPEVHGQRLALERAYHRAGFGIETVAYFEGHGTGTAVGDATELQALASARCAEVERATTSTFSVRPAGLTPAAVGSIKAIIGHTKAAAGIAGLIKATLALRSQILPPTTGCLAPHPVLNDSPAALRVLAQAEPWPTDAPLRAGVSAMGFGGINSHVVLVGQASQRRRALSPQEQLFSTSSQDCELFLWAAADADKLNQQFLQVGQLAPRLARAELADLAATLQHKMGPGPMRAAIVANSPVELSTRLQTLQNWLQGGVTDRLDLTNALFLGAGNRPPRLGFLFPGQGTPVYSDGGAWGRRFATVHALYGGCADPLPRDKSLEPDELADCRREWLQTLAPALQRSQQKTPMSGKISTAVAQPATVISTLAALRVLTALNICAEVGIGHSLGELSALHWAGALDEAATLRIAIRRGQLMAELGGVNGVMLSLHADMDKVQRLLNGCLPTALAIACLNAPKRTVIAGDASLVDVVMARAQSSGIHTTKLAVSHAFHSPLMADAVQPLADYLATERFHPLRRAVISTITGDYLTNTQELPALLQRQVTAPVQFASAMSKAVAAVDLLIEVGAGQVLTGLSREWVETPIIALDAGGPSLRGLLQAAGAAFALGAPLHHHALFTNRFTRPLDLDWQPRFFANPCESAPSDEGYGIWDTGSAIRETHYALGNAQHEIRDVDHTLRITDHELPNTQYPIANLNPASPPVTEQSALALVRQLVAERTELPLSAICDRDRLLNDLHLNSINVSQLVAEAARQLNLAPPVAPTEYANVTIATVAQTLMELLQNGNRAASAQEHLAVHGVDNWVRAFTVEWEERSLPNNLGASAPIKPAGAGSWQVITSDGHPLAAGLRAAFAQRPGQGVVVCLPPQADERQLSLLLAGVQAIFRQLELASTPPCFVLVQQDGGAAALLRTLHLEEPGVTVCVVDLPLDHPKAIVWVTTEVGVASAYQEVRYDHAGRRFEPVLCLQPFATESSPLTLGEQDVLLITGGGKGITAECALALARTRGVRLALMGRSQPGEDDELAANLARMRATGAEVGYWVADITRPDQVQAVVQAVEKTWGPITGVVHGAARNVPQLLRSLDEAAFQSTLAPKVQGLRTVLAALQPAQLRLLVTFGSIIARTGLPGEADYGLANEWLVRLTAQFQQEHPACRCLALEWSVWAGAGMGERLGRLEALVQQGITPIPLDEGVALFQHLLSTPAPSTALVVTGRFGSPPTLRLAQPELPFLRFLEEVRIDYPGVELVVEATLTSESDPYLADHRFGGEQLLPAVIGLEAMAQVAMAVVRTDERPVFADVHFERPVVVPNGAAVTLRLAALVRHHHSTGAEVEVVLRTSTTGFHVNHFRATAHFGEQHTAPTDLLPTAPLSTDSPITTPLSIDPVRDLYGDLLFHKGRFQRLAVYRTLNATSCVAELNRAETVAWFCRYLPAALVLGDPSAHDAAIHAIQVCVPQATLLPVGVERLTLYPTGASAAHTVYAQERSQAGDLFTYDVVVTDDMGYMLEQWQGLRLRTVGGERAAGPWPASLFAPYLERRLALLWPESLLRVVIERDGAATRHKRSNHAIQRVLGSNTTIWRRADGKPEVGSGQSVSAAHAGELTVAVAGDRAVGCDLETVCVRSEDEWCALLGSQRHGLATWLAGTTGEGLACAATRVWCAGESLKKAGALWNVPLVYAGQQPEGWLLLTAGVFQVATTLLQVRDLPEPLLFAIAVRHASGATGSENGSQSAVQGS
jgi:enediyne polyketide synthase